MSAVSRGDAMRVLKRGSVLIEFALVFALLLPLLVWMLVFGFDFQRFMQTGQISRDAGHMFARSVDFSLAGNQEMLVRLAAGLNMTRTGGSGVVILSKVLKVSERDCTDGGISVGACGNLGQAVFVQRIVVGNAALRPSRIGTPPASMLRADGTLDTAHYLTQSGARTIGFDAILNLAPGETAYVAEAWFESPVKDFPTLNNRGPVYARTIF